MRILKPKRYGYFSIFLINNLYLFVLRFSQFTQLVARFATQNVIRCLFSIDSQSFTETENEFLDFGTNIFKPTFWCGIKLMIMSVCPILRDFMPFGFVPSNVDVWFRGLVKELKDDRSKSTLKQQDFLQLLLNSVEKYGMILFVIR